MRILVLSVSKGIESTPRGRTTSAAEKPGTLLMWIRHSKVILLQASEKISPHAAQKRRYSSFSILPVAHPHLAAIDQIGNLEDQIWLD